MFEGKIPYSVGHHLRVMADLIAGSPGDGLGEVIRLLRGGAEATASSLYADWQREDPLRGEGRVPR